MQAQRMQVTLRQTIVAVAMSAALFAIARYLLIDNRPRDILMSAASALDGHSTVYASAFSESQFRSVRIGMTGRQVEELLGPPLLLTEGVTHEGASEPIWCYTRSLKPFGGYWVREIWFRDGVVETICKEFYMD